VNDKLLRAMTAELRGCDPDTAADDARQQAASSDLRDRLALPSPYRRPSGHERQATAHHESAHAVVGINTGASILELRLRPDATGQCRITEIPQPADRIVFLLAGIAAEARFNPSSIHRYDSSSYDYLSARVLIDQLNERRKWPHLTCENAAKAAISFVETHWRAIGNVATALHDTGELDDHAVRVFASCGAP
jgi:hypothetical protein